MLLKLLSVFGFAMIGLWEGVPLGFVLRLPPLLIAGTSALGSTVATLAVMLLGERIQARLAGRRKKAADQKERLIERVWRRYGIIGLGLLAPCLTGGPVGVAIGLLLRAPPRRLLFWMLLGIVLWSALLTGACVYGTAGIRRLITR